MNFSNDMTLVCQDWHRPLKGGGTKPGFSMHSALKENLDLMIKHSRKDWDFVMVVSGHGQVRVGKSVLAQQIGKYLSYHMGTPWGIDNIVFESNKLVEVAKGLPKHSVVIYDEAREGLNSARVMTNLTQNLLNFFTECGQLNHFFILVLPDFFDLPKNIAVTRSTCLIDVQWKGEFERGHFSFYNTQQKRGLYFNGKRYQNYSAQRPSFHGRFYNVHTVEEDRYREKKRGMLERSLRGEPEVESHESKKASTLLGLLWELYGRPTGKVLAQKVKQDTGGYYVIADRTARSAVTERKRLLAQAGLGAYGVNQKGVDSTPQTTSFI